MLIAFNKPYLVHCKFTDDAGRPTLATFGLPPHVYAAGRLDHDSEGLLLLTDDGALNQRITDPKFKQPKTYVVQVDGTPTADAVAQLKRGVTLNDGPTRPAEVRAITEPAWLWPRTPPIRVRAAIPTAWLSLAITEGKNRQVRRMTAAVGHPTLRLIRTQIGPHSLGALAPGQWREI